MHKHRNAATDPGMAPEPLKPGLSHDRIVVKGIELRWDPEAGSCVLQGLPVAMMWVDSTLAGLMSGLATMVGPERFSLALQAEGRKSVESDWLLISRYPDFLKGFAALKAVAAVAGWGDWQLVTDTPARQECLFRAYNNWEGLYQKRLGACWGSAMLAGKLAGICSKRFGTNCWATQTRFVAKGDDYDEFQVAPSSRIVEDDIASLLATDRATRADMAVALVALQAIKEKLLAQQEELEQRVQERTAQLTTALGHTQAANARLQIEMAKYERAQVELHQSEDRLQKIIERSPMSMAIVGMDGVIEYINRKAIETFGYLPEEIPTMEHWWLRAYPDEAYRREVMASWMERVKEAIGEDREIRRSEYRVTCKDGTIKTMDVFGVPVANKVFVMFDDITERRQAEDALRQSHERLEQAVAERTIRLRRLATELTLAEQRERRRLSDFLHDDLQQALAAAKLWATRLATGQTGGPQKSDADKLRLLLSEALDKTRAIGNELGTPLLYMVGIAPALRQLADQILERHELAVKIDVEDELDQLSEDIKVQLFHSVRELLFNTAKHAGTHQARVHIRRHGNRVEITVTDQGKGFDPKARQLEAAPVGGYGLFSISERLENIGGDLQIDSAPGRGTCVTMTVPLPAAMQTATVTAANTRADPSLRPWTGRRVRVLIADDHALVRQGLAQLISQEATLEMVGEAANGEEAVKLAGQRRPDLVVMDVRMPKMDGIEATRQIMAEFPDTVVIGISAFGDTGFRTEMVAAGAVELLTKSDASDVLVSTIARCVAERRGTMAQP